MPLSDEQMLKHLAEVARTRFNLTVWQWKPGVVGAGHAKGSLHYMIFADGVGRAFDAYATGTVGRFRMALYARWLKRAHQARLTEGIYNGRWTKLSVKDGRTVAPSYWGAATWAAHGSHVHVGI